MANASFKIHFEFIFPDKNQVFQLLNAIPQGKFGLFAGIQTDTTPL
jgi:hypothetical protein